MRKIIRVAIALGLTIMMGSCNKPTTKVARTLRTNLCSEPGTLDPRRESDINTHNLDVMLWEGLTQVNADTTVELAQAESVEISEDRRIYTFHLGDNKWSDGTAITAHDFAKTWLDLLDPDFPAPNAYLLEPIKNAMQAKRGEISLSEVGIKVIDDKTLQTELTIPFPAFLHLMANPGLVPICQRQDERYPKWFVEPGHHISNGPFRLADWKKGLEIKFTRNPHYRGKAPKLDAIQFTIINNDVSALHMYASGSLDLIGADFSPIPLAYLKGLKDQHALHMTEVAATLFIAFNTHQFPFNNANIRRAFATAANRRSIIDHITQLDEEPALGAIPPVLKKGRKVNWIEDGNAALAQKYLEEGLRELNVQKRALDDISFMYFNWEMTHKVAQALQQQWLDVLGLHVKVESKDPKMCYAATVDGSYQMGLFLWKADYCDVLALLGRFRHEHEFKNYPHWSNPKYNELLDASYFEPDIDRRLDIFEQAEKILIDDMPIAPLFHYTFAYMMQPNVRGFTINPLGQIYFDELSVGN